MKTGNFGAAKIAMDLLKESYRIDLKDGIPPVGPQEIIVALKALPADKEIQEFQAYLDHFKSLT